MWTVLIMTLPAQPNAVRLRIWRALKALGCAALRDGAYLMPADRAQAFDALADEVRTHGGTALVMQLSPRDAEQQREVLARFDRTAAYADWRKEASDLQARLDKLREPEARHRLRALDEALRAVQAVDYYPGPAAAQAQAELQQLQQALEARFASGEPQARRTRAPVPQLDLRKFQHKRWATRARPWVDRLACVWLIGRFVDSKAEFVWLHDINKAPRGVIGFDYDGARFTHVGALVTFEVMAASFGLARDPAIKRIGEMVRYLDVGGIPAPEAAGLAAVLKGLRAVHADDNKLARAACGVFDALYASPTKD